METEEQKAIYQKPSRVDKQARSDSNQEESIMKRSTDSLYKKLQFTPNNEIDTILNGNSQSRQPLNQQTPSFSMQPKDTYSKNLTKVFDETASFSKNENSSSLFMNKDEKKVSKPSTPTYHAQSSLNFLKHRKKQIIMNQAMGFTYDKIQQLKKSRSKSRQGQSSNNSCRKSSKTFGHKNVIVDLKNPNIQRQMVQNNQKQRSKSISHLQKLQQILNRHSIKGKTVSQLKIQNKRNQNPHQFQQSQKARSFSNSLKSSRTNSVFSDYSLKQEEILSKSRTDILNAISDRLSKSKISKLQQKEKIKANTKNVKIKSNALQERLKNLELILEDIASKNKQNSKSLIEVKIKSQPKEQSMGRPMLKKIQSQITSLKDQIIELSKKTKAKNIQLSQEKQVKRTNTYVVPNQVLLKNSLKYSNLAQQTQRKDDRKIQNYSGIHTLSINQQKNNQVGNNKQKISPFKVNFKYNNSQTLGTSQQSKQIIYKYPDLNTNTVMNNNIIAPFSKFTKVQPFQQNIASNPNPSIHFSQPYLNTNILQQNIHYAQVKAPQPTQNRNQHQIQANVIDPNQRLISSNNHSYLNQNPIINQNYGFSNKQVQQSRNLSPFKTYIPNPHQQTYQRVNYHH